MIHMTLAHALVGQEEQFCAAVLEAMELALNDVSDSLHELDWASIDAQRAREPQNLAA